MHLWWNVIKQESKGIVNLLICYEMVVIQYQYEIVAKDDLAASSARAAALGLQRRLAAGEPFVAAADAAGLTARVSPELRPSDRVVPGIGATEGLIEAAFSLTQEQPHSPRLFATPDGFYVISLVERRAPEPEAIDAELESARELIQNRLRQATLEDWYGTRYQTLERSGALVTYALDAP